MEKYWTIFKISFQQEFAYKLNFVMWRVRNVLQILVAYFLWDTIFSDPGRVVFGYDKARILTYVLGVLIIRALVFSARSVDVPSEISEGNLTNYLLKPINYFKYWAIRDASSKFLNIAFSVVEILFLIFVLKVNLFVQTNFVYIFGFVLSLVVANILFFVIRFITSSITFWAPELAWGSQFLVLMILTEFLSGSMMPLDILPEAVQKVLYFTPFPYLLFFPLQVYLGKIPINIMFQGIMISGAWCVALYFIMRLIWLSGIKTYRAEGR